MNRVVDSQADNFALRCHGPTAFALFMNQWWNLEGGLILNEII